MPGRRSLVIALSFVAALAGSASGSVASGAPTQAWGPVVDVSAGARDVWDLDLAGAGGRTAAVWLRPDGSRTHVVTASKREDGRWSSPRGVPGSGGAAEVEAGLDRDGDLVLVWAAGRRVWAVRRAAGGSWGRPAMLHRTAAGTRGTRPGDLQLAVNAHGRAVVAWETVDDDLDGLYATPRVQAVTGTTAGRWSRVRTLSAKGWGGVAPEVAVDRSGRVTVVWSEYKGRARRVMTASRYHLSRWAVRQIAGASTKPGQPQLAALPSGRLAVAWSVSEERVRVRRWSPRSDWSGAVDVPKASARVAWMDLGMDGSGAVTVAWSNNAEAVWTGVQQPGARWRVARVAPAGSVFYGMEVAVNHFGDAVVGWVSVRNGDHPVQAVHRSGSGAFGPVVALSPPRGDSWGPAVVLEGSGDATAAWIYDGPRRNDSRVQARPFDSR